MVANAKGVEILQVALAYVLQKTPYVFPIVGARKVDHLKGVVPAIGITLSAEGLEKIESAYTFDSGFPHTFLSGTLFTDDAPKGGYAPGDVWLTKPLGTFDWVEPPKAIAPAKSD
jgi:hypothetical protein